MTVPTSPAVSDAREAVARVVDPVAWNDFDRYGSDNGRTARDRRVSLLTADRLLKSGPIASEIARLTGERDAARREVEGYDRSHALQRQRWREDEQFKRLDRIRQQIAGLRPGDAEVIADAQSRIHAAEAEAARLRAAAGDLLEMSAYLVSRHTRIQNGQPVRDLGEAAAAYVTACTSVRAALSSQEKTDV